MTWEGYWLPNLVQWLLGGGVGAIASVVVGVFVRRWLRQFFGEQQQASTDAKAAATTAAGTTNAAIEAWKKRTDDLLTVVLRQETLVMEVERIKEYLAAHEAEKHAARQRIIDPPHEGVTP